MAADRQLLFGLVALQVGLIDQGQLVAAFQAWARDRSRSLADHLADRAGLDADSRAAVDAMVAIHLRAHGGDPAQSLAAIPAEAAREQLAALGVPDLAQSLARVGHGSTDASADRTVTYSVGSATSDGQRFRVLRPHARGGLGAVFVALDQELHREVAVKQILENHADDVVSRQRFVAEAEITGGLEHPGIVPVYGLGSYGDGRPYYAMRFIRGDSLKEAIERFHADAALRRDAGRWSLELRKLLLRFLDVCNAIEYAHARGVLHRDIKPGNIIVGRHGETLVVDWGLAKASGRADVESTAGERPLSPSASGGSAETLPGAVLGTPAYMSPEQARGDLGSMGPASDVYSLGATLYCLLTGQAPFSGDDAGAVLRAVERGAVRPPRLVNPLVDRALEAVCLKAMATAPAQRYPRARALADDVERWMADEPVSAWREPLLRRAGRWARRHRPLVAGAAVLLVSAVAGLAVGAVLINRERSKAEANFRQARAAVDDYFTTVSESKLLDVPGLQPLRKELLESAQSYYRNFLRERGDDPAVRADAAAASFRAGWISLVAGRPQDAIEPLETATALYEALLRAHPDNTEYARLGATAHGSLGFLFSRLDRPAEAMAEHRRALALREASARRDPADLLLKNDVARTHRNIGDLFRQVGKTTETLAEWDEALAIAEALRKTPLPRGAGRRELTGRSDPSVIVREDLAGLYLDRASVLREIGKQDEASAAWGQARGLLEGLVREQPANQGLRARLAGGYLDEGLLQIDAGRPDGALAPLRRGLDVVEQLAAANPAVTQYRVMRTEGYLRIGWVLYSLGRPDEALGSFAKATELAETLAAGEPGSTAFQNLLALALTQKGNQLLRMGRARDAAPMLRRALGLHEAAVRAQPDSVGHQSALATALRGFGRAEAAAGRAEAARTAFARAAELDCALAVKFPGCRYNVACSLALMIPVSPAAEREGLARDAVTALRQAWAAGYANRASVETDADLDALRGRADFGTLLLDLAFPADPFMRKE